jgi:hypothetical protein
MRLSRYGNGFDNGEVAIATPKVDYGFADSQTSAVRECVLRELTQAIGELFIEKYEIRSRNEDVWVRRREKQFLPLAAIGDKKKSGAGFPAPVCLK